MKSDLQYKFLSALNKKKSEKGFTLIELLVVVIIIGVLAAVALPNLLSQVGKAREVEIKNAVGTINRQQQAFHFEKQTFAANTTALGVDVPTKYIDDVGITANGAVDATVNPKNSEAVDDGTRAYSGGIYYGSGEYSQIICQSADVSTQATVPTDATTCAGTTTEVK